MQKEGADGDTADEGGGAGSGHSIQMAGHGHIDHAHKRHRDIGQDAGQSQAQYFLVQSFHHVSPIQGAKLAIRRDIRKNFQKISDYDSLLIIICIFAPSQLAAKRHIKTFIDVYLL